MLCKLYRRREVEAVTGLSRSAIYDGMKSGTFPRPVKITEKAVAWPESFIEKWLASRPSA